MNTLVIKGSINNEQWLSAPICSVVEPEKKSFEEAVAECNAVPLDSFIIELKKRVKLRYQNEKSQDFRSRVG